MWTKIRSITWFGPKSMFILTPTTGQEIKTRKGSRMFKTPPIEAYYKDLILPGCKDPEAAKAICYELRQIDLKADEIRKDILGWGAFKYFFRPFKHSKRNKELTVLHNEWKITFNRLYRTYTGEPH